MEVLVDFAVLTIIYFRKFYKKWKKEGRDVLAVNTAMDVYLSFVLYFTLMPIITSLPFIFNHSYTPMNLVPFIDVLNSRGDFVRQVVLNIIMTIPFGFLLPLTNNNIKILKVVFYTFLLSLSIELLQPLINGIRSADITDLITNVTGGIIGYALYLTFKPLIMKILNCVSNTNSL